jgi:hypothetical protein
VAHLVAAALRLRAAVRFRAVLAAGLFAAGLFAASPQAVAGGPVGPLVINEIFYAPTPATAEFIELYNRSEAAVDLATCTYADASADPDPLASAPALLRPGRYVVLARDRAAFGRRFPGVEALFPAGWNGLNNGGDEVRIRCAGVESDRVPYDDTWGGRSDRSLERRDPNGPSNAAANFGTSTAPAGATPGAVNALFAPDTAPPQVVFAEADPPESVAVFFSEPLAAESVSPGAFAVAGRRPERAALTGPQAVRLAVSVLPAAGPASVVVRGVRDARGNRLDRSERPLAWRPGPGELVINEILYAPRRDPFDGRPDQVEYVELAGAAQRRLSLRGVALTGAPTEAGPADTLAVGPAAGVPPRGHAVVFAAPAPGGNPARTSALAQAFPGADLEGAGVVLLPVGRSTLGLRNGGGRVRLARRDGLVLDDVRYAPNWHALALDDPTGTSLERISASGPSNAPANWTSSAAGDGGTPGGPNSVRLPPRPDAPQPGVVTVAPSPFSVERDGATRIRYRLPAVPATVRVRIYDALGRRVRTLVSGRLGARSGEVLWDGRGDDGRTLRVGVYVVLFEAVSPERGTVVRHKQPVVLARPLG